MPAYFLGVDTGATKSEAAIVDTEGTLLGYSRAGPGNWETIGWPGTADVLQTLINAVVTEVGISVTELSASGLGLAGCDWPEDVPAHLEILRGLGLQEPMAVVNDALLGLFAGADHGWGVVVSAGTSCNAAGRDRHGRLGRMTGQSRFGEYAGAAELIRYALQAVGRAWSLRGPQTGLSEAFVWAVNASGVEDLLAGLARERYVIDARHASLVFAVASGGDAVAQEAVEWAGRGLGDLALGVIRQLQLEEQTFEVILAGSFFNGSPLLQRRVSEIVTAVAPAARISRLAAPPVAGAVLLALEQTGPVRPELRRAVRAQFTNT